MWKRDQQQKPPPGVSSSPVAPAPPALPTVQPPPVVTSPAPIESAPKPQAAAPAAPQPGASLRLKGEISSNEDLILHGRVEGKVSLPGHVLTIGPQAVVSAEVVARTLILNGSVTGNVAATERFEIKSGGRMNGHLTSPNVVMSEGSEFTGGIDMRRKPGNNEVPFEGERRGKSSAS